MRSTPVQPAMTLVLLMLVLFWTAVDGTDPIGSSNCPSQCQCSSVVPSREGVLCRGCPTTAALALALKVTCEALGWSDFPPEVPSDANWLDLSKNNLTVLGPEPLLGLSRLIHLKLSHNNIREVKEGSFAATSTLQILDLDQNNLTVLPRLTFSGAESLVYLDLSGNSLENVDHIFVGLKDLSRLDLRNNRLTQLTPATFKGLTSLRYLLLTYNRIYYVDRRAFRHLEKLVYIVLKGNPIGDQTQRFHFHSNYLTYVDVSECGFSQVPKGLPGSARYVQLRRNNLTSLNRLTFVECPYVTILVLDENRIENVEERTFEHMTQLQQLWLNNNRLRRIPAPLPVSVERLLMDLNRVEEVTAHIFSVDQSPPQINTLSLMSNNISHLSPDALDRLENLKTLDLSNNRLDHIYGNTFARLRQLRALQLSSNPLQFFHGRCFHGLTALKALSLTYVSSEVSMHENVFDELPQLVKLDLDSSPAVISAILSSDHLLTKVGGTMDDLSMRSSDLTRLRSDLFRFLPNLKVLHLSSTRWHCDRSLVWLRDWMTSTAVKLDDVDENRCATPRSLHGRALLSLDRDEFVPVSDPAPTPSGSRTTIDLVTIVQLRGSAGHPFEEDPSTNPGRSSTSARPSERGNPVEDVLEIYEIYDQTSKLHPPPPPPRRNEDTHDLTEDTDDDYENPAGNATGLFPGEFHFPESGSHNRDDVVDSTDRSTPEEGSTSLIVKGVTGSSRAPVSYSRSTIAFVIATVAVTLIIAVLILGVIFYLTRDKRARRTRSKKESGHVGCGGTQGGIPYKHKNGILYYTPSNGKPEADPPDLLTKTASGEVMTLVPGRDFNHEGPMRVYKWEDF